ncbi:MAG: GH1 family beta-glucosidase [Chthoniobacteraceae bacterium]
MNSFPEHFTWGVASAAYQIEGAALEDGKGASVWDMMCRQPGRIYQGHTGAVACDHYHHYKEDVALMRELQNPAYRLSVSWPRVMPEGTGKVNAKGLEFYDQLIDELLAAKITPWVTLFHWDYPYELYLRGGWLNRDTAKWFADYTQVVVAKLSDRVQHWMTLNEPQCFIGLGHQRGIHAPGDKLGLAEILTASHHTLLAHGQSVQAIRATAKMKPTVGWAVVGGVNMPEDESKPADVNAARQAMFSAPKKSHEEILKSDNTVFNNAWWADPAILGKYPEDFLALFGDCVPKIAEGDLKTIAQPLDFYGVNIYNGGLVRAGADGSPQWIDQAPGGPRTTYDWPVSPTCLYWGPKLLQERYRLPIVVTENGLGSMDWVTVDGAVPDAFRIDFLTRYLHELGRAIGDGVDVRGYFHWSIMDNFEWNEGYKQRFGLVHVDYQTQKRTPKQSAHWYREVTASNGRVLFA